MSPKSVCEVRPRICTLSKVWRSEPRQYSETNVAHSKYPKYNCFQHTYTEFQLQWADKMAQQVKALTK